MKVYVRQHEAYIKKCIAKNEINMSILQYHDKRIEWLAHERLIHLLVFLFTLLSLMTFFVLAFLTGELWVNVIVVILLAVSFFYCLHYFFLENAIQRWYLLSDKIRNSIDS